MAVVRKKPDDKYLKVLRELVTTGGGNRQCFDCGQKGPTYVNMTIGSFVCTRCSGVVRGLTPPHRVKSISMATFTQEEIDFLKAHGNELCAKTWLGLWDPKRAVHQDHRELMIDKYERKRYYLEPASPLKSLTNAASLTKPNTLLTATTTATHNSHNNNGNSHAPLANDYQKQLNTIDNNNFKNIQLTPPTSQRNTVNGLHKTAASASSTAISRPQHTQHQQLQNGYTHHPQKHQHQDAFMMINNGLNGLSTINSLNTSVGSSSTAVSTGAHSDTSSCASANGFGPEADFVADFGSASIFDATSVGSVSSPAVSSASSVASSNGYAKIQPIKAAQQHKQHLHLNGTSSTSNGDVSIGKGNTENFADFDHAPIFNAAVLPIPSGSTATSSNAFNNNNSKLSSTPGEDRYAALKDLDEQLRESKAVAAASMVSSTVVESFGNDANSNSNSNVNPFKSQQQQQNATMINPFQHGTQPSQGNLFGQMTVLPNGIAAKSATAKTNAFAVGHQTQQPSQQQQQPQQPLGTTGLFNYSNGLAAATTEIGVGGTGDMFSPAMISPSVGPLGGPNGCGFGFGTMQQQIAATSGGMGGVGYNNPFAAASGALNSNNPFL